MSLSCREPLRQASEEMNGLTEIANHSHYFKQANFCGYSPQLSCNMYLRTVHFSIANIIHNIVDVYRYYGFHLLSHDKIHRARC